MNKLEYLTEQEAADLIKRSVSTLRKDRHYGRGLPYIKNCGQILYIRHIVDEYLLKKLVMPRAS